MDVLRDVIGLIGGALDRLHDWITGGRPRLIPIRIPSADPRPSPGSDPSSFRKHTDR